MAVDWSLVTSLTLDSLGLDELVAGVETKECYSFGLHLAKLTREEDRWTPEQQASLDFIVQVLLMGLQSDNHVEPYGPMFTLGEERRPIPAGFPREELNKLGEWIETLRDPELRARFFDVWWVQGKHYPAARQAVAAYLDSAIRLEDPDNWPPCMSRFERAVRLAASLGKGGSELRARALGMIEEAVRKYHGTDPLYLTAKLTRLMMEFGWGDLRELARFNVKAARAAETARDFWRAREYHSVAADCYRMAHDAESAAECQRAAAEALALESDLAFSQPGRGALTAATILSDAIEAMRRAPGGKDRAEELHTRLLEMQQKALPEFKSVSAEMDTTELVHQALARVAGKPLQDAIIALCGLRNVPSIDSLRTQAETQARISVFASLMTTEVVNARGRLVAKVPPWPKGVVDIEDDAVRWRMYRSAQFSRHLAVDAVINPARQVILSEHAPSRDDIMPFIEYSPWVPPNHRESICRALVAGFGGDMLLVAHLVPIQFEAVVRHALESAGAVTTTFEAGGVQKERTLGALLEMPESVPLFGQAGVFELQDLLADQLGRNLRNEVAHGLLEDGAMFSPDVLYAWWLLLKYCVWTSRVHEVDANIRDDAA
ncbi:DUF4209 domain-containing protein [Burkholderia gladioli]|uniref:DUF4209 domain-containing protein n=1 Tax=Burkholderia gladioli TaxID=28095 RepID=UPI00163F968F|nr:DUF4209 domain-containing protein [Burkholderia gladioli]